MTAECVRSDISKTIGVVGCLTLPIVLGFLMSAVPLIARADCTTARYGPFFQIGGRAVSPTNTMIFLWNHETRESARLYRDIIHALDDEIQSHRLVVFAVQVEQPKQSSLVRAARFLCPAMQNYPRMVLRYFSLLEDSDHELGETLLDKLVSRAARDFGVTDQSCPAASADGGMRVCALRLWKEAASQTWPTTPIPALLLNGENVSSETAQQIRARLKP